MPTASYSLIISDLHLSEDHPETTALFFDFLKNKAAQADALYILGDLFEYWIGDDDCSAFNQSIIDALKQISMQGVKLFIMRGNRDILLGKRFAHMTGGTLLKDPTVAEFYQHKMLLMHGDLLCTNDVEYLKWRKVGYWANGLIPWLLLRLPLSWRRKIALKLRQASKQHYQQRQQTGRGTVDVTEHGVLQAFPLHCYMLIHGHTHRMGIYYYPEQRKRIVLGDWHNSGSYVEITPSEINLTVFQGSAHV